MVDEKQKSQWRAEFEKLGREAVRAMVSNGRGAFPEPRQHYEEAAAWLREKEIEDDKRASKAERRAQIIYVSLAILLLAILVLKLVAFGVL